MVVFARHPQIKSLTRTTLSKQDVSTSYQAFCCSQARFFGLKFTEVSVYIQELDATLSSLEILDKVRKVKPHLED